MKDDYYKKVFKKNRQRVKILVARDDFQSDIRELRKKYKIPAKGFSNERENRDWHNSFYESDDEYFDTTWRENRGVLQKLERNKKFREAEKLRKKLNDEAPVNSFRIAIKNLLKKYKIPLSWEHSIQRYIYFNEKELMWLPAGITLKGERDKDTGLEKLWIGIEDYTTLEDVKRAWKSVRFQQKQLHSYIRKKFQPIKNFDRDQEAYKLKKEGKSYLEIADILSEKYNKTYSYDDVSSFLKRYKKKTGNN